MKHRILAVALMAALAAFAISCGTNVNITNPNVTDTLGIAFGTDSTFDVITWNIENFPKNNPETSNLLRTLIPNLKADCIAIQEVRYISDFVSLVNQLPGWGYYMSGIGDTKTAIIYNTNNVQVDSSATIFTNMTNPFPRPPLLIRLRWQGEQIIMISLHLKAFGNNVIEETNPNDEEVRRRYACQLLDQYIMENFSDSRVIVVGDWNDQIQEPESTNVFMSFLSKPDEYKFADMSIAMNLTAQNCSYPGYFSHLDHILITNELFRAFSDAGSYVRTINVENFIAGGWNSYDKYISDHRPVGARFRFMDYHK